MNNAFGECDYRTPCNWCVKWDKACDKKQGSIIREKQKAETLADVYPTIDSYYSKRKGGD